MDTKTLQEQIDDKAPYGEDVGDTLKEAATVAVTVAGSLGASIIIVEILKALQIV